MTRRASSEEGFCLFAASIHWSIDDRLMRGAIGTYTCTASPSGQFAMRRLEAGIDGISGAIVSLSASGCSAAVVTMGGARVSF